MIYVALAEAAALVLVAGTFAGLVRSLIRQHARERDLLVNQVCNLAGKPWEQAPARDTPPPADPYEYQASPEQYAESF